MKANFNRYSALLEEDHTITYLQDSYTHEQIFKRDEANNILKLSLQSLKNKFGADIILTAPKIAYEAITKKVKVGASTRNNPADTVNTEMYGLNLNPA